MYQPMLYLHWKQVRLALIPFMVASFGLPLLTVQGMGTVAGMDSGTLEAYRQLSEAQFWLPFFPVLAGVIGVTLGLSAWNWDHQLKHVYALSLPLRRTEYAMLKMGAGALLAVLPAVAMWIGGHVAAASLSLPSELHAYPNELAFRFFLAVLLSYSLLFAMAAGTVKTTLRICAVILVFVVLGNIATGVLDEYYRFFARTNVVEVAVSWLMNASGPFEVFMGNWTLIDV
ncbi:MAG: hypothetical protein IIB36_00220 [Gemmatimonadetes bacterium]|nr:hypothetical protein [Gemmatimonadota bacterium]